MMKLSNVMQKVIRSIIRLRIPLIIFFAICLGLSILQMKKMKIDNSLDVWFVKDDPTLLNYRYFQKEFGNDEVVAVVFGDERTVDSPEYDLLIRAISSDMENTPMIKKVHSILTTKDRSIFLSKNKRTTMLVVELESIENIDVERTSILKEIKNILDKHLTSVNTQYHLAGLGVVYDALNQISLRDSNLFISLSYFLIFLILAIFIRRIRYILISFIIIICAVVITMGLYYAAGKSVNMVTMVLPTLIMIFGVADVIHIVNRYFHDAGGNPGIEKFDLVSKSLAAIAIPCFLTSLTTSVGFASLTISKMQVIQDLGLFASIGIMIAFFLSIIISTIAFSFLRKPVLVEKKSRKSQFLNSLASFIIHRWKLILVLSLGIFILFGAGIVKIRVDTFSIQFLRPSHQVRQDSDFIEEHFGYYTPIEFTLHAGKGDFLIPSNLQKVKKFQNAIEEDTLLQNTVSLATLVPNLSHIENKQQLSTILNFIPEDAKSRFVNKDLSVLRIMGRTKMLSARGFKQVVDRAMIKADSVWGDQITVKPNGYIPLYIKMMDYIMNTQLLSFSIAFFVVFAIIALYAGSIRLGAIAILPNLFPLAITLGIMGWTGIRLDIATVTITAIAIGVVVDDTMHFLYKYKILRASADKENAIRVTIEQVGWPVISTSVILICGFLIVTFAQVNSIRFFGILSAIVIFAALLGDLFILPSLILILRGKEIKDGV